MCQVRIRDFSTRTIVRVRNPRMIVTEMLDRPLAQIRGGHDLGLMNSLLNPYMGVLKYTRPTANLTFTCTVLFLTDLIFSENDFPSVRFRVKEKVEKNVKTESF